MSRRRASVSHLLAYVLLAAIAMAALRAATGLWAGVAYLATLFVPGAATLGAACCRGEARAWWLGFAAFGWGYLYLGLVAPADAPTAAFATPTLPIPDPNVDRGPILPTTRMLDAISVHAQARPPVVGQKVQVLWGASNMWYPATLLAIDGTRFQIRYDDGSPVEWVGPERIGAAGFHPEHFRRIGHAILALLIALVGAAIARHFHRTREGSLLPNGKACAASRANARIGKSAPRPHAPPDSPPFSSKAKIRRALLKSFSASVFSSTATACFACATASPFLP